MDPEKNMSEEEFCLELDFSEPPPELMKFAKEYVGEDPDTRAKCIQDLRNLIYEKGECTPIRTDDAYLLKFLRARKFVPERAHRLLVNYYTFKKDNPQYHVGVEPLKFTYIEEDDILTILPYKDQAGRRILIYKIGKWDPNIYPVDDLFKATLLSMELGILEPKIQILGGIVIFDLENINMSHVWQMTPTVAFHAIQIMGSSFPVNIHAVHFINHSWIFNKIYNVFKPLLNNEMTEKIYFHGDKFESLHKHIDLSRLPKTYGGTRIDYPYILWIEPISKNNKVIEELISAGYKIDPNDLPFSIEEHKKKRGK